MKQFKFKINGNAYEVSIESTSNGMSDVTVNGVKYSVEVENDALQATAVKRPSSIAAAAAKKTVSGDVKSQLPGSVVKILVSEGQKVSRGDVMMIIESMKMENNIIAQADGVIRSIMVQPGQSLLQGDLLLRMETANEEPAPAPAPVAPPAPEPKSAAPKSPAPASKKSVTSQLPGSIVKVVASAGKTVAKGDVVMVIESMKMENNILAPRDGKVSAIHVEAGQSVLQGDALFDLD